MDIIPNSPSIEALEDFYKCTGTIDLIAWHQKHTPWVPKEWLLNNLDRYDIENFRRNISKDDWVKLYFTQKI